MVDPDRMFRALADRTRLRILNLLRDGETCVGDLVTVIAVPQPQVSRHLAYLRRAGLVEVEREANWSFYRLAAPGSAFHERLIDCLGCCVAEVPLMQQDARALSRLRKSGGCCTRTVTEASKCQSPARGPCARRSSRQKPSRKGARC